MIHDKFTAIRHTMSRQQLWQMRKTEKGLCSLCSKPMAHGSKTRCDEHAETSRKYNRKKMRERLGIPIDWPRYKRFNK